MKVVEIFTSFMGEQNSHGIGTPAVFVRFFGCSLGCAKCDTKYAVYTNGLDAGPFEFTPKEIAHSIRKRAGNFEVVCLTGGEPLEQNEKDMKELLELLSDYYIVIETNGNVPFAKYANGSNISFVVDYKMPGLLGAYVEACKYSQYVISQRKALSKDDVIKFVLYDENDFGIFLFTMHQHHFTSTVAVGLAEGSKLSYKWLMQMLTDSGFMNRVKFNFQVHKLVGCK